MFIASIVNGLGYEDSISSRNLVCEMSTFNVDPSTGSEKNIVYYIHRIEIDYFTSPSPTKKKSKYRSVV